MTSLRSSLEIETDINPRWGIVLAGSAPIILVSFATLTWPMALASSVLGALMFAGAEVDARTFLLPDFITLGALAAGIVAALALDSFTPAASAAFAMTRALVTAAVLLALRFYYLRLRGKEGIGLGDIKLAGAVGAWLPLRIVPTCFVLASLSALFLVCLGRAFGRRFQPTTKLPFGAFLCPALWVTFYISALRH